MATPFPFVANTVLTASQLNAITELPSATKTASYTLVAADAGTRVVMNVASANTATVNNSVFSAGQIVQISNIGAGVTTVTAGAGVTINSADVLTLAQYQGGSLVFSSASAAVWFPTAKTVSAGGLVFLTGASFTTATSFSLPADTFSATYENYKIIINVTGVTSGADFSVRLRASGSDNTTSNYMFAQAGYSNVGNVVDTGASGQSSWSFGESNTTTRNGHVFDLLRPQIAQTTAAIGGYMCLTKDGANTAFRSGGWFFNATTQFDSLSFISSVASSITGNYKVYGYANS